MPFKIMLIDDEVDDSRTTIGGLKQLLEDEGYEVAAISDGVSAYDRALAFKPDVIVLDLNFGRQDITGTEICEALRRDGCQAPIILITKYLSENFSELS